MACLDSARCLVDQLEGVLLTGNHIKRLIRDEDSDNLASAGGGLLAPNLGFLGYAIAFLDRMVNSLRFFVRCGSR